MEGGGGGRPGRLGGMRMRMGRMMIGRMSRMGRMGSRWGSIGSRLPRLPGEARRLLPEDAAHPYGQLRQVVRAAGLPIVQVGHVDHPVLADVLVVRLDDH